MKINREENYKIYRRKNYLTFFKKGVNTDIKKCLLEGKAVIIEGHSVAFDLYINTKTEQTYESL